MSALEPVTVRVGNLQVPAYLLGMPSDAQIAALPADKAFYSVPTGKRLKRQGKTALSQGLPYLSVGEVRVPPHPHARITLTILPP